MVRHTYTTPLLLNVPKESIMFIMFFISIHLVFLESELKGGWWCYSSQKVNKSFAINAKRSFHNNQKQINRSVLTFHCFTHQEHLRLKFCAGSVVVESNIPRSDSQAAPRSTWGDGMCRRITPTSQPCQMAEDQGSAREFRELLRST